MKKNLIYIILIVIFIILTVIATLFFVSRVNSAKDNATNTGIVNNTVEDVNVYGQDNIVNTTKVGTIEDIQILELTDAQKADYNEYLKLRIPVWRVIISMLEGTLTEQGPTKKEMAILATYFGDPDDANGFRDNVSYMNNSVVTYANFDYVKEKVKKVFGVDITAEDMGDLLVDQKVKLLPPFGLAGAYIYKSKTLSYEYSTGIYTLDFDMLNGFDTTSEISEYDENLAKSTTLEYKESEVYALGKLKFKKVNDEMILISFVFEEK